MFDFLKKVAGDILEEGQATEDPVAKAQAQVKSLAELAAEEARRQDLERLRDSQYGVSPEKAMQSIQDLVDFGISEATSRLFPKQPAPNVEDSIKQVRSRRYT
jgi:hypothetical protein